MRAVVLGLVAAFSLAATAAQAAPITYTFSGLGNARVCAVCDGSDDTNYGKAFSLVINSDTSLVDNTGLPYSRLSGLTGQLTMTFYSATLTGIQLVSNGAGFPFENIDFFSADVSNGLGFSDPSLFNYDLTQNYGPVTVDDTTPFPSFLQPTFGVGNGFDTTGADKVYFTSNSSLTFSAVTTGVPEPLTLSLFGIGVAGAAFARRRKKA